MASFRIHEDQENLNELKRPQRVTRARPAKTVEQQQKRSVLGVLNANPSRSQSLKTSKEEAPSRAKAQTATFSILEDGEVNENKPLPEKPFVNARPQPRKVQTSVRQTAGLPSLVTNVHRPPLQELPMAVLQTEDDTDDDEDVVSDGSPMTCDTSVETIVFRAEVLRIEPTLDQLLECEEYRDDIYAYLLGAERRNFPKPYYMKKQPDISYSMRSILVDWLVEVAEEYNLQTETLYLAVGYIDRFLSVMSVVRAKLQLVGTAAMFIASKYEEIYPPDVGEFVYITDDTYSKKQVLRMEHLILKVLSFDLSRPTPLCFIVSFCAATKMGEKIQFLAMYVSELALLYADPFLQYAPSVIAASCIAIARHATEESTVWSPELEAITGYAYDRLVPCIAELRVIHAGASAYPQQAVREKYRSSRRHCVACVPPWSEETSQ